MGSPTSEADRQDDETQHSVTLTQGFYIQTTEVTQGQWQALMGNNPSYISSCGSTCPVEQVSWTDALGFANALSAA
ncbi:MAG: formylglycine-generating enzyme family protein, partial [bacterium]